MSTTDIIISTACGLGAIVVTETIRFFNLREDRRGHNKWLSALHDEADKKRGVPIGDYQLVSSVASHGFARNKKMMRAAQGTEVKFWGYVDHSNVFP